MCGQYFAGEMMGGNCPCGHYIVSPPEVSGDSTSLDSKRDVEIRSVGGDRTSKKE